MKKMGSTVLIQLCTLPWKAMLDITRTWHKEYCDQRDITYLEVRCYDDRHKDGGRANIIREMLAYFDNVIWLDADTIITGSDDLRQACSPNTIGAVKFDAQTSWGNHYNVGAVYLGAGVDTERFVDAWKDAPFLDDAQREQGTFNSLAKSIHVVVELSPIWNYTINRHFGYKNPAVLGFHSVRGFKEKLRAMKGAYTNGGV